MDNQPGGAPPLEHPHPDCGSDSDTDYLVIRLFGGGPTTGDTLEFMVNQSAFEYWQNPYSAGQPASDTKSEGGVSVGAVDPALGSTIGYYSSHGPTNDGRTKPDLAAAACVKSFTAFPGNCFNGTSAATPVTAGAAALVLEAFPFYTPADLKSYLLNQATVATRRAGHRQRVRRRGAVPAGRSGHPAGAQLEAWPRWPALSASARLLDQAGVQHEDRPREVRAQGRQERHQAQLLAAPQDVLPRDGDDPGERQEGQAAGPGDGAAIRRQGRERCDSSCASTPPAVDC